MQVAATTLLLQVLPGLALAATPVWVPATTIPSVTPAGASRHPVISADGSTAVFVSDAPDLVANDRNDRDLDVFARSLEGGGGSELISVGILGRAGNGRSHSPSVSANGRYVAFVSEAADLVEGDTNGLPDVFLRDRVTGITRLVSVDFAGTGPGNGPSTSPTITPNGRFVAFESAASNLARNDSNNVPDVFLRDVETGVTHWISVPSEDPALAKLSPGPSQNPAVSSDGTRVVFFSSGLNLAPAPRGNLCSIYIREVVTGLTRVLDALPESISNRPVPVSGVPVLTPDGRWLLVSMSLPSLGLEGLHRFDLSARGGEAVSTNLNTAPISTDGPFIADNGQLAVFQARHLNAGVSDYFRIYVGGPGLESVLVATNLVALDQSFRMAPVADLLATDRRCDTVAYLAYTPDPIGAQRKDPKQLWVTRRSSKEHRRIGRASWHENAPMPSFSADGRKLLFASADPALVPEDRNGADDVFLYEWDTGTLTLVSSARDAAARRSGALGSFLSPISVSRNGQRIAFVDPHDRLTASDTNQATDVLVLDRATGATSLGSSLPGEARTPNGNSYHPSLNADGTLLSFVSLATNLVPGGPRAPENLYLRRLADGATWLASLSVLPPQGSLHIIQETALSPDGQLAAFVIAAPLVASDDNSLPDVYVFDRAAETLHLLGTNTSRRTLTRQRAGAGSLAWSPDGRRLVFISASSLAPSTVPEPFGGQPKWYVWDTLTRNFSALHRIPTDYAPVAGADTPAFSGDGSLVAITVLPSSLPDAIPSVVIYHWDDPQITLRIDGVERPSLGMSGPRVVVRTFETPPRTGRLKLVDLTAGTTAWIEPEAAGAIARPPARWHRLSQDGQSVFFTSAATDLHPLATNGFTQLYLHDVARGTTLLLSVDAEGRASNRPVADPVIAESGSTLYFTSAATNLDPDDVNEALDLFAVQLSGGGGAPTVVLTRLATGSVTLVAAAEPGARYHAEFKSDLEAPAWTILGGPQTAAGPQVSFDDPDAAAQARRFYRIVRE